MSKNNGSPLDGNQDPTVGTNGEGPGSDQFVWEVDLTVGACDPSFVQADRRNIRLLTLLRDIKDGKRTAPSD